MSRLTPEVLVYDLVSAADPQVSPDGTRVAHSLGRANHELDGVTSQIYLSNIDGTERRQLTSAGELTRHRPAVGHLAWSPDGRQSWCAATGAAPRYEASEAFAEFARYPGGAHAVLRVGPPSHRLDLPSRLLGWFSQHLQ